MTAVDYSRVGKRSRRRGARGENEVRDLIRKHGWQEAHRNFMSGGAGGGDLADAIPDTHLEVKMTERLDLPGAWRQAQAAARPTDLIVIVSRCNFQPWIATFRLLDLLGMPHWIDWCPMVIGPRANLRTEFMGVLRDDAHPLVAHQAAGEAMVTVLFEDLLVGLEDGRLLAELPVEPAA